MALDFPATPAEGATYTSGNTAWQYDGGKWVGGGVAGAGVTSLTAGAGLTGSAPTGDVGIALQIPVAIASGGTAAVTAATALVSLGALPISGGTLTGALNGTTAAFTALQVFNAGTTASQINVSNGTRSWNSGVGNDGSWYLYDVTASAFRLTLTAAGRLSVSGNDPLEITAPSGFYGRARFSVAGTRIWSVGTTAGGDFAIADETASAYRLTISTAGALSITGTAAKPGGGVWADNSDVRTKRNIKGYTSGLAQVLQLEPVSFEHNGQGGSVDDGKTYVGLVANHAKDVMPEMVSIVHGRLDPHDDHLTEILSLDATALIYAMVNAIKTLKSDIDELRSALT